MKIILPILLFIAGNAHALDVSNGMSFGIADGRYVNSPSESVSQTFVNKVAISSAVGSYNLEVGGAANFGEVRVNGEVLSPGTGSNWSVTGSDVYRAAGNVGIRTTAPTDVLHVNGGITGSTLTVTGSAFSVGGSTLVVAAGKVGIGTTAPQTTFEVANQTNARVQLDATGATNPRIRFADSANAQQFGTINAYDLNFVTGTSTRVYVANGGNVGIGTTAPDQKLTVAGNISLTGQVISSGTGSNYFAGNIRVALDSANVMFVGSDNNADEMGLLYTTADHTLSIRDNGAGANRVTFKQSGFVGISSTTPAAQLGVTGGIIATSSIAAQGGFYGDGANITNFEVHADSGVVPGTSIATTTDIGLATATIVLRGGRNLDCVAHANVSNAAAGPRVYTYNITKNSVKVGDGFTTGDYSATCSGTDTCNLYLPYSSTSVAGSTTFSFIIRSSNATGTQTALHASMRCEED